MDRDGRFILALLAGTAAVCASVRAETIQFSGYTWEVRSADLGLPGPNPWSSRNVWVDEQGSLHLRLTRQDGRWSGAEIHTQKSLGFGCYELWLRGRVDQLDQNVVFGLFNYPSPEMGPDRTHEIDIEFARWGNPALKNGNYTVWPVEAGRREAEHTFEFKLTGNDSTHRFVWGPAKIDFQSLAGHVDDDRDEFARWRFQPEAPHAAISQRPMPFYINLYCYRGRPPANGQPVELVVRAFEFTPGKPRE